jgi:hypothetical protein
MAFTYNFPWHEDGPDVGFGTLKEPMPAVHITALSPRPWALTGDENWTDPWGKVIDANNGNQSTVWLPATGSSGASAFDVIDFPAPLAQENGTNSFWPSPGALSPHYHTYEFNRTDYKCYKFRLFGNNNPVQDKFAGLGQNVKTDGGALTTRFIIPSVTKKLGFWIYSDIGIAANTLSLKFRRVVDEGTPATPWEEWIITQTVPAATWTFIIIDFVANPPVGGWVTPPNLYHQDKDGNAIEGMYYSQINIATKIILNNPANIFYITGGRLIIDETPVEGDEIWGEGGCNLNELVERAANNTVDLEIPSSKIELDTFTRSATSTNDLLTKITAQWLTDYFNNEPQLITFKNNVTAFGLREATVDFFTFNDETQVRNVLEFWGRRKSNYWQTVKFKAFLHGLQILPFDNIVFRMDDIIYVDFNIIGMVTSVTYSPDDFSTEIEVMLAVKTGLRRMHEDFWREHSVLEPSFA